MRPDVGGTGDGLGASTYGLREVRHLKTCTTKKEDLSRGSRSRPPEEV